MNPVFICKTVGALAITLSCAITVLDYARCVGSSLDAARDAERFVRFVGEAVRYRSDDISDIIGSYDTGCIVLRPLWKKASETTLSAVVCDFPFDEATRRIMTEFASELGRGYRDSQIELCSLTSERLRAHIDELSSSKSDRLRVACAVAVFISMSFIILFL